jgi:hypothetical protein
LIVTTDKYAHIRGSAALTPALSQRERGRVAACVFSLLLLLSGCSEDHIDTHYGVRSEPGASGSVNGTAVLAEMFEQAGHRVTSWRALSPRLSEHADCIVWFPNDFEPPSVDVRDWLEEWLRDEPDRTLIYVGRDFDAASWYWAKVQAEAPREQAAAVAAELEAARTSFARRRSKMPESRDCDWFTADGKRRPRKVRELSGDSQWLKDIDPARLEIELNGRIIPAPSAEVLLRSKDDMLVSREPFGRSQLIVVTNGSFLLNLPLVNHEHRKLAGKLIDQIGAPGRKVVFLESHADGPPIHQQDPAAQMPSGLEILTMPPVNWIFVHFAAVGILLCFSRWLIHGVPRQLPPDSTSDFGKHIRALAELLERSGDREYATSRVAHYQQRTGDRGQAHLASGDSPGEQG